MKAIQFSEFGTPEVLQLVELPIPTPKTNEVLIRVAAAGINPIDYKIRDGSGHASARLKERFPAGLGYEMAGEIVAVGSMVTSFSKGDKVCGFAGHRDDPRCYADYVATAPDMIIKVPAIIEIETAAGLPLAGLTALQALRLAKVKLGQRVLIHAGAGGVGHIAVQLAKIMCAYVITTASLANHEFLYELGADECIDYHTQDFVQVVKAVNGVIDLMGFEVGLRSMAVIASQGWLVTVPSVTAQQIVKEATSKGVNAAGISMTPKTEDLNYLIDLMVKGKLKIFISKKFPLKNAVAAHHMIESKKTRGKLILICN